MEVTGNLGDKIGDLGKYLVGTDASSLVSLDSGGCKPAEMLQKLHQWKVNLTARTDAERGKEGDRVLIVLS